MTGISVGIPFQIILVFRLRLPEITDRCKLGHNLSRPQTGRIDVGNRVLGNPLLLVIRIENRRAVTQSQIVALAVERCGIVNLEKDSRMFR